MPVNHIKYASLIIMYLWYNYRSIFFTPSWIDNDIVTHITPCAFGYRFAIYLRWRCSCRGRFRRSGTRRWSRAPWTWRCSSRFVSLPPNETPCPPHPGRLQSPRFSPSARYRLDTCEPTPARPKVWVNFSIRFFFPSSIIRLLAYNLCQW